MSNLKKLWLVSGIFRLSFDRGTPIVLEELSLSEENESRPAFRYVFGLVKTVIEHGLVMRFTNLLRSLDLGLGAWNFVLIEISLDHTKYL